MEGKQIGDDIRLSSIELGEGMKPTILGRDFMLSTIQAPKVEEVEITTEATSSEESSTEDNKDEKKEEKAAE